LKTGTGPAELKETCGLEAENEGQGGGEIGMFEAEACGEQFLRQDARAAEQHLVGHFAERQAQGESRRGENGRAVEESGCRFGEFGVG